MYRTVPLSVIRSFSLYTQQWYMSYRFADSLRAGSGRFRPDPARKLEFYSKNKFEKLVYLVGFIIRSRYIIVLMHWFDGAECFVGRWQLFTWKENSFLFLNVNPPPAPLEYIAPILSRILKWICYRTNSAVQQKFSRCIGLSRKDRIRIAAEVTRDVPHAVRGNTWTMLRNLP